MKKNIYSITTVLLIGAALSLSSCLKDSNNYIDFTQSKPLVELPLESYNLPGNLVAEALPISSTPQVFPCVVNVASPSLLTTSTSVTLGLDTAAVTAYNAANQTTDVLLPASSYTVSSWTVTIAPGEPHTATMSISVNTSLLDPSNVYILPVKIVSAPYTVDQYNELLFGVQVKNQYDGVYVVTGTLSDNTTTTITGAYPETVQLQTLSANSDVFYDVTNGYGFGHAITSAGATNYYGSFAPVFSFNGSTVTGVTNYYGQFSGTHMRSAVLDPSGTNAFTTGTPGQAGSVFQVTYDMQQGNPGVTRTVFTETWTYQGSR